MSKSTSDRREEFEERKAFILERRSHMKQYFKACEDLYDFMIEIGDEDPDLAEEIDLWNYDLAMRDVEEGFSHL